MQEVERSRSQSRNLLDQSCPGGAGDSFNNKQTLPVFSYPVQSLPGDWSIKIPAYPRGTILQTILLSQHGFKAVISFWQASDNHWPKIFSYLLFLEQDSVAIVAIRIASLNPFHGTSIITMSAAPDWKPWKLPGIFPHDFFPYCFNDINNGPNICWTLNHQLALPAFLSCLLSRRSRHSKFFPTIWKIEYFILELNTSLFPPESIRISYPLWLPSADFCQVCHFMQNPRSLSIKTLNRGLNKLAAVVP